MLTQSKWSVLSKLMVVLTILYIIARIIGVLYILNEYQLPILGRLLFPFSIEVLFLIILILIPREYRVIAILPLIYLILKNSMELISFLDTLNSTLPTFFVIQYISSRIVSVIVFIAYSVLLLPSFHYHKKHVLIATLFLIPFVFMYVLNILINYRLWSYIPHFDFVFHIMLLNYIIYLTLPVIFVIYVLNDILLRKDLEVNE